MPAILINDLTGALRQGDLLDRVQLYASDGEDAVALESQLSLVLSRHCAALRAPRVLVISVREYEPGFFKELVKEDTTLEKAKRIMSAVRDGHGEPDVFYLGELPGREGVRYAARLNSLHTIQLPTAATQRTEWVAAHRFARLSPEHRRHLHGRLFGAIAYEGFDDLHWWSERDLQTMVRIGEREVTVIKSQLQTLEIEVEHDSASLGQHGKKQRTRARDLAKLKDDLAEAEQNLAPYLAEHERRARTA